MASMRAPMRAMATFAVVTLVACATPRPIQGEAGDSSAASLGGTPGVVLAGDEGEKRPSNHVLLAAGGSRPPPRPPPAPPPPRSPGRINQPDQRNEPVRPGRVPGRRLAGPPDAPYWEPVFEIPWRGPTLQGPRPAPPARSPVEVTEPAPGLPQQQPGPPPTRPGPPNPYGSRGGPAHQNTVERRINELKAGGHQHVGGGELREEEVKTPEGAKSSRRPDITTLAPDGSAYRENVGRSTASGAPVARERKALDDIEAQTGARPGYTPYDR